MKNQIDHQSPIPLHIQVEQYLRELIMEEDYQNGKLLPNEVEMSKLFGISRNTFRAAMDRLVVEGLVVRKKGIGTKVNFTKIATTLTKWDSFTKEMNAQGKTLKTISKKITWVQADIKLAKTMGIEEGTLICCLERIQGVGKEPVVVFVSYFHPRVEIKTDESFEGPLYRILEDRYHSIPTVSNEQIGAMASNKNLSMLLEIKEDIPILFRKRNVLNDAEKLLEYCEAYYRSDRFLYTIQIRRENE